MVAFRKFEVGEVGHRRHRGAHDDQAGPLHAPILTGAATLANMAVVSNMIELGTPAPDFALPDTRTGHVVSLSDFAGAPALVVTFLCNHCPYVQRVAAGLAELGADLAELGVPMVGISSNDVERYPQDGPEEMAKHAARHGWTFPYLYDRSQQVARAYSARCTPDTFVFDADRRLVYRGQLDNARPRNDVPVTAGDVRAAVDAVLAGTPVPPHQLPSSGCGIKWRPGQEPA